MTKVAVTGASGFIGQILLSKLIKNGYEVNVLDAEDATYLKSVKVFKGNLLIGNGIDKFLEGSSILIHLAGQVLPGITSMEDGNVKTTKNLISKATGTTIKKIIFSSSVSVYGDSKGTVFKETDVCNPNTQYGQSKHSAEKIIIDWSEKTGGQSVILRFFSIYGPENKKGVIFNLCKDFIEKRKVVVFGNGHQRRDLVHVDDAAELLELYVKKDLDGIYNVGSGKYYSILDIISILEEISGKKCEVDFKKAESEKVDEIFYSIDKLKNDLDWTPKIDIKEGLRSVYTHILRNGK